MKVAKVSPSFWNGKRVFMTGHTGFKGGWLSLWLISMGAKVTGYALAPNSTPNFFQVVKVGEIMEGSHIGDIRDLQKLQKAMLGARPEIVIHMAAQPLVRISYANPVDTYATNVMGTVHLLESIKALDSVRAVVVVTTDKCYQNEDQELSYREDDPMGGFDPYSSSKGCAELVTNAYRQSYFSPKKFSEHRVAVASARAGNVIGGGDWSEDRLIPDLMRALENSGIVEIRSLNSIRPWQHVLEPLLGYIILAEKTYSNLELARAFNFGPDESDAKSVFEIVTMVENLTGKFLINNRTSHNKGHQFHEAGILMLDTSLSKSLIKIVPRWTTKTAIEKTVNWYTKELVGNNAEDLCNRDIDSYLANI
jgi:CDP-glucose 4,6-dehydratase